MKNWSRDDWFDDTGLPWINPSPNMRNLNEATLYPGIGAIEGTNVSVGRGTDTPFEQVGAPWIDGVELADALNARGLPGVRFYPVRFTPVVEQVCEPGMPGRLHDRHRPRGAAPGARRRRDRRDAAQLHGTKYQLEAAERLFGSREGAARIRPATTRPRSPRPGRREARGGCCGRSGCKRATASLTCRQQVSDLYRLSSCEPARSAPRFLSRYIRSSAIFTSGMMSVDVRAVLRRSRCSGPRRAAGLSRRPIRANASCRSRCLAHRLLLAARNQHQELVAAPAEHVVRFADVAAAGTPRPAAARGRRSRGPACR